jgi:hypothetical protein
MRETRNERILTRIQERESLLKREVLLRAISKLNEGHNLKAAEILKEMLSKKVY